MRKSNPWNYTPLSSERLVSAPADGEGTKTLAISAKYLGDRAQTLSIRFAEGMGL